MGIFNHFPYTNVHELNLDWVLAKVRELENGLADFVKHNTIKYADPIAWDITRQYEANTVVIDPMTGNAYLSTKPVPGGVAITTAEYWTGIFNYQAEIDRIEDKIDINSGKIENAEGDIEDLKNTAQALEAASLPAGGTAGQMLVKRSATDYDADWEDLPDPASDYVTPELYGALGDGQHDDGPAFRQALASGKKIFCLRRRTYAITAVNNIGLDIPDNTILELNESTIALQGNANDTLIRINNTENISITNGTLKGNRDRVELPSRQAHLAFCTGGKNVVFQDVLFADSTGDGLYIGNQKSEKYYLTRVICDNNGRNGCSITNAENVFITDCSFINTNGSAPQLGIDLEPNLTTQVLKNIHITGCDLRGNVNGGLAVSSKAEGDEIFISDCNCEGCFSIGLFNTGAKAIISGIINKPHRAPISGTEGWEYNSGSGIGLACVDGSTITVDGMTIDCSNEITAIVTLAGLSNQARNCTLRNITAINGKYGRVFTKKTAGDVPKNISAEIKLIECTYFDNGTPFPNPTEPTCRVTLEAVFTPATAALFQLGHIAQLDDSVATTNYSFNGPLNNAPLIVKNAASANKNLVGQTYITADGATANLLTIPVGSSVEIEYNAISGHVKYRFV